MSLSEKVVKWDGKSAEEIGIVYERFSSEPGFIGNLFVLLEKRESQIGASWLLKRSVENGEEIETELQPNLFTCLKEAQDWETRLHLLQIVPHIRIEETVRETLEHAVRNCLGDKNKFVRAWAYGAFYLLADSFPEYRAEVRQFIDAAMIDEPASVKARIRNVTKKGFMAASRS